MFFAELAFALLALPLVTVGGLYLMCHLAATGLWLIAEIIVAVLRLFLEPSGERDGGAGRSSSRSGFSSWLARLARSRWVRRLGMGLVGGMIVIIGAAVVVDMFFLDKAANRLVDAAADESEMEISTGEISGSLVKGRLTLEEITVERENHRTTNFDVEAGRLHLDVNLPSLLGGTHRINTLEVEDVKGQLDRVGQAPSPEADPPDIVAEEFRLENIELNFVDHVGRPSPAAIDIEIDHLVTSPLRSRFLWFDAMFSTETSGTIADGRIEMSHDDEGDERHSRWSFENLPVHTANKFIGGPFDWLEEGRLDLESDYRRDTSAQNTGVDVESRWSIVLRDLRVESGTNPVRAAFARYVEGLTEELRLEFSFQFDDSGFSGAASPHVAGLWDTVTRVLRQQVREQATDDRTDGLVPGFGDDSADSEDGDDGLLDRLP